jgi:hypothetical protein
MSVDKSLVEGAVSATHSMGGAKIWDAAKCPGISLILHSSCFQGGCVWYAEV